ncbi:hypothetical protein HU200_034626 [Digitaria exilis]|uniref:Uncharacterized protein n=1 Tax=Digitaria exilis TaxID=1010633 RepID=A0A835BJY7_9POAL|nr:hypothetical protein HU200_034626 [Digitaria exilis]
MKIAVESTKAVKPKYGNGSAPSMAADTVKLTVLDRVNFDQYISTLYFFSPQTAKAPPNAILEQGLSKTLAMHREWAGRFGLDANGDPAILLNDEGVRFVEATADVALGTNMPVEPTPELLTLYPSDDGADELMLVQVTWFACGSLVVAVNGNHLLLTAWAIATCGVGIPLHNRTTSSIFMLRNPARIEFEHRGVEFKQPPHCDALDDMEQHANASGGGDKVVVRRVHFSADMVSELKALASPPVKCVVSHLWRCISKARGLDGETPTTLKIAVNGAGRVRWQRRSLGVSDHHCRGARGHAYFRSFIDFASSGVVEKEGLVPAADPTKIVLCPDVEVNSLVGIPVNDVDFGAGRPFLFIHGYLPQEGLVFITSSSSGDGSIDAQVSLFSGAMDIFKNCCYAISGSMEEGLVVTADPTKMVHCLYVEPSPSSLEGAPPLSACHSSSITLLLCPGNGDLELAGIDPSTTFIRQYRATGAAPNLMAIMRTAVEKIDPLVSELKLTTTVDAINKASVENDKFSVELSKSKKDLTLHISAFEAATSREEGRKANGHRVETHYQLDDVRHSTLHHTMGDATRGGGDASLRNDERSC